MPTLISDHGFSADMIIPLKELVLFRDAENREFDPEKMKEVVRLAEAELEREIPLCPASLYHLFVEDGNRAKYEAPYFRRREMALRLALAEAYEGKGRFTKKLVDVVWAIMEESGWVLPAHLSMYSPAHGDAGLPPVYNESRLHGIDLFSAATSALLSLVYALDRRILDAYCPLICEKIRYTVRERHIRPFIYCTFHWMGLLGNAVNNWNPWVISNTLYVAAIMAEDDAELKTVVARAAKALNNYTKYLPADGGCDEGPNYWTVAGSSYFDCLELLYDLTGGAFDIYGDPYVRSMFEYIMTMHIHANRFANYNDSPPFITLDGDQLCRMGEKCGSEALVSFGRGMITVNGVFLSDRQIYRTLRGLISHYEKAEPSAVPVSRLPALGIMTAHSCSDTGKGTFLFAKGGSNAEGHNHNDVGNVMIYRNGAPVIIDTGAGEYTKQTFSPRRYELWYMRSAYHNVADIGGHEQRDGGAYRSTDVVFDRERTALSAELKDAYPRDAGIISYRRSTCLEGDKVTLTDSFELEREQTVDLHFITCEKPVEQDGEMILAQGVVMKYDPLLSASVEEFPVNDRQLQRTWNTPVLWRIHLRARISSGSFTVTFE